jgi:drug/metabolite transporter (DMT)-like permease
MQNYFIAVLLFIGAIHIAVFSSLYDEKKDKKMIGGIVAGVLVYAAGLGLAGMNNKISAVVLAIGSILVALCSYFYNKNVCDDGAPTSKKRGLVVGIILGIVMLVIGVLIAHPPFTVEELTTQIEKAKNAAKQAIEEAKLEAASMVIQPQPPTGPPPAGPPPAGPPAGPPPH